MCLAGVYERWPAQLMVILSAMAVLLVITQADKGGVLRRVGYVFEPLGHGCRGRVQVSVVCVCTPDTWVVKCMH